MKKFPHISRYAGLLLAFILFTTACRKEDDQSFVSPDQGRPSPNAINCHTNESSEIVKPWYDLLLNIIKTTPGHTPPIAAREIGYTGISLYEATTGGVNGYHTLAGQVNGLTVLPTRVSGLYIGTVAANATLARIIKLMVGNASVSAIASIDSLENVYETLYAGLYNAADFNRSRTFGRDIADAVYNWSTSDNGHLGYLNVFPASYIPPTGPGYWVPTPPAFSAAMLPYWGNNRTFAATNSAGPIDPPPAYPYSTHPNSTLYKAAMKVYTTVNNLTQSEKDIANFWADGGGTSTPPGHAIAIAVQLIRSNNLTLDKAAALLAKSGMVLNDAGIVCWRAKFANNMQRPLTYIQTNIDPAWSSYITTPPFPTYTSGHSSFSAAVAKILSKQFGGNTAFTDSTKLPAFAPRYYTSFTQAAQEAADQGYMAEYTMSLIM